MTIDTRLGQVCGLTDYIRFKVKIYAGGAKQKL